MPRMTDTPIFDALGGSDEDPLKVEHIVIPDDVPIFTETDDLGPIPEADMSNDQAGGRLL